MTAIDAIEIGSTAEISRVISEEEIAAFARLSGDYNPLHIDAEYAARTPFQKPVAHGVLLASYVSTLVGMHLPGPGALWTQQSFQWLAPVFRGDEVRIRLTVKRKSVGAGVVTIEISAVNQDGKKVMQGEGTVMLLEQKSSPVAGWTGKQVAFVTGASRGIGAAIASALGAVGISVAVNYRRSAEQAEAICRRIEEGGGSAVAVQADVTDADAVAHSIEVTSREFGAPVSILVNNAAAPTAVKPFLELDWASVQAALDEHVRGAYNCCRAVIPGMLEAKSGRIINISSALTRGVPPPQWTAFVLAKSALASLTKSLAVEFGPHGILVNMVSPGMTETESIAAIPERLRKVQAMQNPLRRLGSPEDIAAAVAFLCSDAGRYVTGADIPVCGGSAM